MSVYAVDALGHVYTLSISSPWLRPLHYVGLEIKRLCSASKSGSERVWALGGDHQLYLLVSKSEICLRVKECLYENQRWNPLDGFCHHLLPTDRPRFSSKDGRIELRKDDVNLPSLAWNWDEEWRIEPTLDGRRLKDPDGWSYAVDFPGNYSAQKQLTSCVRRRKWVRHRKYVALDTWAPLEPVHRDVAEEPFMDVAIGGQENSETDHMFVWTITVLGRILVRTGVRHLCPEGENWRHVQTPQSCEVSQISVAPSGLVWAVTWNGRALVRLGVTAVKPLGTEWVTVESPGPRCQLSQVCVGHSGVWALSRDRRIFFRQGVRSELKENAVMAKGSKWMEMVGELSVISVGGPNDFVFGITNDENHTLVLRTGITKANPTGNTWKPVSVESDQPRVQGERRPTGAEADVKYEIDQSMYMSALDTFERNPHKSMTDNHSSEKHHWLWLSAGSFDCDSIPSDWLSSRSATSSNESATKTLDYKNVILSRLQSLNEEVAKVAELRKYEKAIEFSSWVKKTKAKVVNLSNNNQDQISEHCVIELELSGQTDSKEGGSSNKSGRREVDFGTLSIFATNAKHKEHLSLLDLSCVRLESSFIHSSSIALHSITRTLNNQPPIKIALSDEKERNEWLSDIEHGRKGVLNELSSLKHDEKSSFLYALSSSGEAFVTDLDQEVSDPELKRMDDNRCVRDLKLLKTPIKRSNSSGSDINTAIATLNPGFKEKSALSFTLRTYQGQICPGFSLNLHCGPPPNSDIALHINPRPERDVVVINTRRNGKWDREQRQNFVFSPSTNDDDDENNYDTNVAVWQSMRLFEADSVVHVLITALQHEFEIVVNGMKYAHFGHRFPCDEITHVRVEGQVGVKAINHIFDKGLPNPSYLVWFPIGDGHFRRLASSQGVVYALGHDNTPWMCNLDHKNSKTDNEYVEDMVEVSTYENQRWTPISGFSSASLLPTDRYAWSDVTGTLAMAKENFKLPSSKWKWNGDWYISEKSTGTSNKEGWQYATDFPMSYHSQMTLTDCVRRRKWSRRAKFRSSDKSRWKRLSQSVKLNDIALQPSESGLVLWAVTTEGDALIRETKNGSSCHVTDHVTPTWRQLSCGNEERFVALDADKQAVWAIGKDGNAYVRHGVTSNCILGQFWLRVSPPSDAKLKDLAVGSLQSGQISVWALDTLNRLYVRLEVTDSLVEGTTWKKIEDQVLSIAVNQGRVWAVLKQGHHLGKGVVARRLGVTKGNPGGFEWNIAIGGGFESVSCS